MQIEIVVKIDGKEVIKSFRDDQAPVEYQSRIFVAYPITYQREQRELALNEMIDSANEMKDMWTRRDATQARWDAAKVKQNSIQTGNTLTTEVV